MTTVSKLSPDFIQSNPAPKVTVCVVTYNQKNYIAQCLQSVLDQEVDFSVEIVIADDHSTDGTYELICEFERRHPFIVRVFRQPNNIGAFKNFHFVHNVAKGEYVCHLDGDDYLLPNKLKYQVSFMDASKECVISWHRMDLLNETEGTRFPQHYEADELSLARFHIIDLAYTITLGIHSSKMYRRGIRVEEVTGLKSIDFSENIQFLHQNKGWAGFLPTRESLGVYRVYSGISLSRAKIRTYIYEWLNHFYVNNIIPKDVVAAKMFWMFLSDIRHASKSAGTGFKFLLKMILSLRLGALIDCKKNKAPTSMSTDERGL